MEKLNILSIDAWGNAKDGYHWNNWFKVGTIDKDEFESLDSDKKQIKFMVDEGYLNEKAFKGVEVEDDQYNIVFADKKTGEPLYAIEYGPHY